MTSNGNRPTVFTEHRFLSFDKTPVYFRRYRPRLMPKGALLLVHGMGEHSGRYDPLSAHLADAGFSVYLPDLRGFGQSGGKRGCVRHFTDYFRDLEAVCRLAREAEGFPELFFLGHSYGGLVVSSFLAERPALSAKGLILSSPNFGISVAVPFWRHALAHAVGAFFPDLTQPNGVQPRFLTHDPELLRQRAEDRLVHDRISAGLYLQLTAQMRRFPQAASELTLPTLLLQAGDDRVVSRAATERFYALLASPDKRLKVYESWYHEIFNETSRQAVFGEVSSWLLERA